MCVDGHDEHATCVCMHACTQPHFYEHTRPHAHSHICITHLHAHTRTRMGSRTFTHMYTRTRVRTGTHTSVLAASPRLDTRPWSCCSPNRTCIVMAYIVMTYIVMAYIVMACIVMAYIVMALVLQLAEPHLPMCASTVHARVPLVNSTLPARTLTRMHIRAP